MHKSFDPFSTNRMSVPNLTELLARLRDETLRHGVTVIHARKENEGDWVLANASARLSRGNVKIWGPEPLKAVDVVEQAVRVSAKVVFVGELRRDEDARAVRTAAALGIHPVGVITAETRSDAEALLTMIGPWKGFDIALLSQG